MFAYLASLNAFLRQSTIEYVDGHYLTLMTCTEWSQPRLYSPDSKY